MPTLIPSTNPPSCSWWMSHGARWGCWCWSCPLPPTLCWGGGMDKVGCWELVSIFLAAALPALGLALACKTLLILLLFRDFSCLDAAWVLPSTVSVGHMGWCPWGSPLLWAIGWCRTNGTDVLGRNWGSSVGAEVVSVFWGVGGSWLPAEVTAGSLPGPALPNSFSS